MVRLCQIDLSIYRSNPVCECTNDRPVAALRAAPRRMFIFDASSLAPLGSRRPSAGASRPRMFGSQARVPLVVREWGVLSISETSPSPAARRSDQRSSAITERREGGCRNLFSGCPLREGLWTSCTRRIQRLIGQGSSHDKTWMVCVLVVLSVHLTGKSFGHRGEAGDNPGLRGA